MKSLLPKMLMIALIAGVTFFAYAGRDNDRDGPLTASATTKKNRAKIRAYANVNGGYYKWRSGSWSLTAVVPNQITEGESTISGPVQFNSYLYETLYHRGKGNNLSQVYLLGHLPFLFLSTVCGTTL